MHAVILRFHHAPDRPVVVSAIDEETGEEVGRHTLHRMYEWLLENRFVWERGSNGRWTRGGRNDV